MDHKTLKKLALKNQLHQDHSFSNHNPLMIKEEKDSINLTGTTAASDMNYYFDEIKQENNENPGNKTKDHNLSDLLNNYK